MPRGTKLIVGHGGSAALRYRNVLEALQMALAAGADTFEFDVRRTGDGTLVVHHDADVGATMLAALDYAAAAAAARALGYRLPRLADVLQAVGGRLQLDVELKEAGYEDAVARALVDSGVAGPDVLITSFEQPAIDAVQALRPSLRTGLLVSDVPGATALDLFRASGAALLCPDYQILDDTTLERARAEQIPLLPWTVNSPGAMRRLLAAPAVAGLITDEPGEAVRVRDALGGI